MDIVRFAQVVAAAVFLTVLAPTDRAAAGDYYTDYYLRQTAMNFANRIIYGLGDAVRTSQRQAAYPSYGYGQQAVRTIPPTPSGAAWIGTCHPSRQFAILRDPGSNAIMQLPGPCWSPQTSRGPRMVHRDEPAHITLIRKLQAENDSLKAQNEAVKKAVLFLLDKQQDSASESETLAIEALRTDLEYHGLA